MSSSGTLSFSKSHQKSVPPKCARSLWQTKHSATQDESSQVAIWAGVFLGGSTIHATRAKIFFLYFLLHPKIWTILSEHMQHSKRFIEAALTLVSEPLFPDSPEVRGSFCGKAAEQRMPKEKATADLNTSASVAPFQMLWGSPQISGKVMSLKSVSKETQFECLTKIKKTLYFKVSDAFGSFRPGWLSVKVRWGGRGCSWSNHQVPSKQ